MVCIWQTFLQKKPLASKLNGKKISEDFLELASEQRINIILSLFDESSNLSKMAKKLDATTSEVHRNFNRLLDKGIIIKDSDGNYSLSLYGKTLCHQIPSLLFISENQQFFKDHDLGDLSVKFIQRLGALRDAKQVSGFVKVLEKWKEVHNNANKYLYNILAEVPYSEDIINIIDSKLHNGIAVHSIFSEKAVIPNERKKIFAEKNFQKYVKDSILKRRMRKDVSIVTLLNEKEACLIFPKSNGKSDMSEMFYSSDPLFHEWCYDYFMDCWNNSASFQESKLE